MNSGAKKMEKGKVIFFTMVALVLISMTAYYFIAFGDKDEKGADFSSSFVPELEDGSAPEYTERVRAIEEMNETRTRTAPSIYNNYELDAPKADDTEAERMRRQAMVDSIYAAGMRRRTGGGDGDGPALRAERQREKREEEALSELQRSRSGHKLFFNNGIMLKESLDDGPVTNTLVDGTIHAEINGNQKVKVNSRVEMRLTKDAVINGTTYPKNTYLYGFVTFGANRVFIDIPMVDHLPVALSVYDRQDGGRGLYIVNSFIQEAGRETADRTAPIIRVPGLPPASLSGVRNVLQRRNRNIRATVVNKYQILIKPNNDE